MTVLFILLSINLDSLVTGFAYGVRRVKIPLISAAVISCSSIAYSALAMAAGSVASALFPPLVCRLTGALVLIIIGLILIANVAKENELPAPAPCKEKDTLFNLVIKSFGITISVVRDPTLCDFDRSQRIDFKEALYLSFALSADAIGVGLGCAMSGIVACYIPPLVGLSQLVLLYAGLYCGKFLSKFLNVSRRICSVISGIILIALAMFRIFS